HVTEVPFADVPGEDSLALSLRGRLSEGTGTRDRAVAHVEPVAGDTPARNVGHGPLSSRSLAGDYEIRRRTMAAVDEETLRRMQAVTSETCRLEGPCAPQHVGDLAWMRFQHRGREQEWRVRLWQRNGEDVAWAWLWHSDSKLFWCLKPDLRESLVGEVLDWAEALVVEVQSSDL